MLQYIALMVLSFAMAFYIPSLNSTLLGINLTTASSEVVNLFQFGFIILGFYGIFKVMTWKE